MRVIKRQPIDKPEIMIVPMIDVMFVLVVFFMFSALYMVNLKTVTVNVPKAVNADLQTDVTYLITIKPDGTLWLENGEISLQSLLNRCKREHQKNPRFAIVLRADKTVEYGKIISLLDKFKGLGIIRFGLATQEGDS